MNHDDLISYIDSYLRVTEIDDSSQNGLQVQGPNEITKVAVAVDLCQTAIDRAVAANAQLLIVHHGLLWDKPVRLVGSRWRYVKNLIENGCGLYAAHLPLDLHPEVGNNAGLARLLGLKDIRPFGKYKGIDIGVVGESQPPTPVPDLVKRLSEILTVPPLRILAYGAEKATCVVVISGGAAMMVDQVETAGYDTFITGETMHAYFHEAADRRLNVILSGHYATETIGVKALARHLSQKFALETIFLDIPTQM